MIDTVAISALTLLAIILFFIGVPIILVFGIWVIGFHYVTPVFPINNVATGAFTELQSFSFIAIPIFILIGDLIYQSDISTDIVNFSNSLIGKIPGSSGNTTVVTSAIFSAITGSNAATTASVGKAMHPEMVKNGYDSKFSAATVAAGGTVGSVIPPSIMLIIYGVTFGESVVALFVAGLIPGLVMLLVLLSVNTYIAHKRGYKNDSETNKFSVANIVRSSWNAKIALGTVVILIGGILGGIFTPSEGSAIAVVYIMVASLLTGRIDSFGQVARANTAAILLVGVIMPLIVFATLIQQNLSFLGIQDVISNWLMAFDSKSITLILMFIIMLFTGSFLASVPNLLLTVPLLTPAAMSLGIDPISWAIIFIISDSIGFITPPYGLNLYVISGITDIDYLQVAYSCVPYLIALLMVLVLYLSFPSLI